nr:unnamed protein product [Callosobruchus chinensis]
MDSETEIRCKQLTVERGQIKATLTRFVTFLDKYSVDQLTNLEARLGHIETLLIDFNKIQSELEILNEDESQI